MSNDDIIKKYQEKETTFVATEEDLKTLTSVAESTTITKGEYSNTNVTVSPVVFENKPIVEPPQTNDDLKTDYQYIRTNLYAITERSVEALNNLVQIADQSQHPRAYEVVALLVNTIASAQRDLIGIHRERAKIDAIKNKDKTPDVVNNNLFIGNTAQLDEIIKNLNKKDDE